MTSEVENLVQRVENLERQNRQFRLVGLGIALCVTVVLFAGANKAPRIIEAEKIVLVDSHGRARLTIGTPAFAGATIDANPDDPVIWMTDDKGADRAMLTIDGLFFANSKATPTVSLRSDPNGTSWLKFYGTNGKVSWSAP
jgi:hypothetical protein